jgi:hypothetical protein
MITSSRDLAASGIRTVVVTNAEQLSHAYAVRSICFMEETGLTAYQAFDGNDFQATHIVVYAGDEPIGAARLRWFNGFAKIERTAFRKAYRSARTLRICADFVFAHVARKGYSRLITHASEKYARVWVKVLGFEEVAEKALVHAEGQEPHKELVKRLNVPNDAITSETPSHVLFRIEGSWHSPSTFG